MLNFRRLFVVAICAVATAAFAQTSAQPTIWASKPDVAAFEKMVTGHLADADAAVVRLTSVKGILDTAATLFRVTFRQEKHCHPERRRSFACE